MILAEKILHLRKKSGWSQEELAEKLSVSRQSVSKWESAASIPDINKILEMARLFGVSTDYLLKDELEAELYTDAAEDEPVRRMDLARAKEILNGRIRIGRQIALGVLLCILSPVLLVLLSGMAALDPGRITEGMAAALGLAALFALVAVAVVLFIRAGYRAKPLSAWDEGEFTLEYGVSGILTEMRRQSEKGRMVKVITGVLLCILCVVPLLVCATLWGEAEGPILLIALVCLMFLLAALGVCLLVSAGAETNAYDRLLGEGEFEPERREMGRKFGGIYWPCVTAVYLLWSFLSNDWQLTWVVWPAAALLFSAITALVRQRKQ